MKMELDRKRRPVRVGQGLRAGRREIEMVSGSSRFGVRLVGRRKGHPASHYRNQGVGLNVKAIGIERQIDAAGIPEPGVARHEFIVGRIDKNLNIDRLATDIEVVAYHPAYLDTAVRYRRSDFQRAE